MDVLEIDFAQRELVERYDRLFENCPNAVIQQSSYWADVISAAGPDKPLFLLARDAGGEDIGGLPLYLYQGPLGNVLTSVPQAGPLGGIFCRENITDEKKEEIYRCLLEKADEIARRHQCLSLTLITNPFCNDLDLYNRYLSPDFTFENFTQYVPLTESIRPSNSHSKNVNKAKKTEAAVVFCDNENDLRSWYRLHEKRHLELGAAPLKYAVFEKIFTGLVPRNKARIMLVKLGDAILSGCVHIYHRRVADVFMLSMDSACPELCPNFLNTDYSIDWMRRQGIEIYNWQSSESRQSGVYAYKRRWGSLECPYFFVTKLYGGGVEEIRRIGMEKIRRDYQGHYVVPFGVFDGKPGETYFRKGG